MEGQGHMPPAGAFQKCDFCFATFQTLSELICHSCIHAPGNIQNRDLYQAPNFLSKNNFNNPGFANFDEFARQNRLHTIDKQAYNNFYESPFSSSSQLNFTQQIPAAHQNIPPAHQQIASIHTPIFSTDKGYSTNYRDNVFLQQCSQAQPEAIPSHSEHMNFNPELFQTPSFTATKVSTNSLTAQKKPIMKPEVNGEQKPAVPRKKKTGTGERNHKCYLCGSAFLKRSHLVEHLPIHTGERPFKCETCGQAFIKKSDLSRHSFTHTGQKPFKCEYCDAAYTRKSILRQHVLIHTNEKPFKCTSCIAAFNKKPDLTQHMLIHTGEKPFKCDSCESAFTTKNQLKDHKASHTGEKLHKCILCGASFKRRKGLKRHHRIHTGKKPHKCEQCEACFVEKSQLKVHMRIHTGEKPFKCDQCGAAFRQKGLLTIHQNIHQGSKQYQCDQCSASFSQKCNLTIHKRVHSGVEQFNQYLYQPSYTTTRIQLNMLNKSKKMEINEATAKLLEELTPRPKKEHTGEKNHKCTHCDAAFSRKSHLKEHELVHTGEKRFKCDLCDSSFTKKSDLVRHLRIHTGDKPFKCKQCDASFMRKANLTQHMTTHSTAPKPLKCKYCSGVFLKKSHLEEHQITHTTNKTYICEQCDAAFLSKQKLKDHRLLHDQVAKKKKKSKKHKTSRSDQDKTYLCKTCGEAFHKKSTLTRHSKTHAASKTFKCEVCSKTFEEKDKLKKHLKTHMISKPFECEKCEATFAQKGQMTFHMKSHEGSRQYKCDICSCSFSRKPSLINHNAMHRQKAQERELTQLKVEPEDDYDDQFNSSLTLDDDGLYLGQISGARPRPASMQVTRRSNKRKGFPKPHRPMKKKIKWIEGDEFIKAEIEEEEDEDYIVESVESKVTAVNKKVDKKVSDTEDDEEDSIDEELEVNNDDKNVDEDNELEDIDEPEDMSVIPDQNGLNRGVNNELKEQVGNIERTDNAGLEHVSRMKSIKQKMKMENNFGLQDSAKTTDADDLEKFVSGNMESESDNHILYRETNVSMPSHMQVEPGVDNRYGQLNSVSREMDLGNEQKQAMSEAQRFYQGYSSGALEGNDMQQGANMESDKMARPIWPTY